MATIGSNLPSSWYPHQDLATFYPPPPSTHTHILTYRWACHIFSCRVALPRTSVTIYILTLPVDCIWNHGNKHASDAGTCCTATSGAPSPSHYSPPPSRHLWCRPVLSCHFSYGPVFVSINWQSRETCWYVICRRATGGGDNDLYVLVGICYWLDLLR